MSRLHVHLHVKDLAQSVRGDRVVQVDRRQAVHDT